MCTARTSIIGTRKRKTKGANDTRVWNVRHTAETCYYHNKYVRGGKKKCRKKERKKKRIKPQRRTTTTTCARRHHPPTRLAERRPSPRRPFYNPSLVTRTTPKRAARRRFPSKRGRLIRQLVRAIAHAVVVCCCSRVAFLSLSLSVSLTRSLTERQREDVTRVHYVFRIRQFNPRLPGVRNRSVRTVIISSFPV